ncbi:MAG: hypothetical protein MUE69_29130 [Myxococcota bacterium]|nr:hypothetical protein [Myxococcota bacterium]
MTYSRVPQFRSNIAFDGIVAGWPVAATDWQRAADVQNWIAGRGRQVIPPFRPDHGALEAPNNTYHYALRIIPSYPALEFRCHVGFRDDIYFATPWTYRTPILVGEGAVSSWDVTTPRAAYNTTTIDATLAVLATARDVFIDTISVFELPRAFIEQTALAGGVSIPPLAAGQPITSASVESLADATADDTFGARVLAFHAVPWATGVSPTKSTEYARASSSSSYAPGPGGNGIAALARKKRVGDTTRTCKAAFFGWCSDGSTTGQARVTSSKHGSSTAVSISGTTPAWGLVSPDVVVDCEDLDALTGLQGGTFDELTVEFRRTSGSGEVYLASWIVYE